MSGEDRLRICPQCRTRTTAEQCPHDGFMTVPEELVGTSPRVDPLVGHVYQQRYRVDALLGRGGFGSVYRAVQLNMGNRPVALKVLRKDLSSSLEQIGRFQREAQAASLLQHPNTIKVFDFGQTDDGDLFMVVELLDGEPLSRLIARERFLPAERAVRVACQVLRSLAEAHDRGIVHRDIKPDNIFIQNVRGEQDLVKVLDFGVAKLATTSEGGTLTRSGAVLGSPAYMAPEQALGKVVDHRVDLYATGVMLYEMLSGRLPFDGTQVMQLLAAHVVSPVPPLAALAPVSEALAAVVHRCLEKDPDRRPQTADALRLALEDAVPSGAIGRASRPDVLGADTLGGSGTIGAGDTLAAPLTTPLETPPTGSIDGRDTAGLVRDTLADAPRRTTLLVAAGGVVALSAIAVALWWPRGDTASHNGGEPPRQEAKAPEASGRPPARADAAANVAAVAGVAPRADVATGTPSEAPPQGPLAGASPQIVHVVHAPVTPRGPELPAVDVARRGLETQVAEPRRPGPRPPHGDHTGPPEGGIEWQ